MRNDVHGWAGGRRHFQGESQIGFLGSWRGNGLPIGWASGPRWSDLSAAGASAGSFGKQPCPKPRTEVSRKEDQADHRLSRPRHGSHPSLRPNALVSIVMVPHPGRNPPCRVFGDTTASSPSPGAAPPGLTRLPAPRSRGGHSSPSRKVGSAQRAQPTSPGLAHLHGNVTDHATAAAEGQSRRARRLPGPARFRSSRPRPPSLVSGATSPPQALRLRERSLHGRARPQSMATSDPPPPESSPNVESEAAQQHRPSVSWKLTSPAASAAARKTSGTYPASAAFQRHRLISRPEINLGTQPQICFLQPRTSQPLVLFRCGRSGC